MQKGNILKTRVFENNDVTIIRGGSRGRVQEEGAGGGCRLSNTTGILQKKKKQSVTPFLSGTVPSNKLLDLP